MTTSKGPESQSAFISHTEGRCEVNTMLDDDSLESTIVHKMYCGRRVPEHVAEGLIAYVRHGRPVGGFLTAVLCNDLKEAVGRADEQCLDNLVAIVGWLYNEAPAACWGSLEKVNAWKDMPHEVRS